MGKTLYDWAALAPTIVAWVKEHGPGWRELARRLEVPYSTLATAVQERAVLKDQVAAAVAEWEQASHLKAPELGPPPPPEDPREAFDRHRERLRDADRRRELEAMLKAAARDTTLTETLVELVREVAPRLPPPAPVWTPPAEAGATEETMVQELSDWHLYEAVSAARTRGLGEYGAAIGAQRAAQVVATHGSIVTRLRRSGWAFPELVIPLLGDFHPGTIHELERHSSDGANAVTATWGTAWVLAHAIRDLAALYPRVFAVGVSGNHGRLPDARRMQQKDPTRNWDFLVYLIARQMLADCENVSWWLPDSYAAQVEIRGWEFLLTHGHEIKSWNSIPHYGISRFVQNTNAVEAARGQVLHYVLLAHFHEHSTLPHAAGEVLVNGSLIGPTEFGINALGRAAPPHQLMFGVHREHGVTHRWPLRVDQPRADLPAWGTRPWEDVQAPPDAAHPFKLKVA